MKEILTTLVNLLLFAIFGRVIISWLLVSGVRNDIVLRLDYALSVFTEPIMRPLRRVIPTMGRFDITPMVAIILLSIVSRVISATL